MDLLYVFLLSLTCAAAEVVTPKDVTLHCGNLNNTLTWTYPQLFPGLKFRINIDSAGKVFKPRWVDAPKLQADVSFLSDPNNEYLISVTAVIGQNESSSSENISFSYFKDSVMSDQICSLDLPPVTITAELDDKLLVKFQHPALLYPEDVPVIASQKHKKKKKRHDPQLSENLPEFQYSVEILNQARNKYSDTCMESVCELTFPVTPTESPLDKHCLSIKGELRRMDVIGRGEYCIEALKAVNNIIYLSVAVGLLGLIAIAGICFMVYKKMTSSSSASLPSFLKGKAKKNLSRVQVRESVITPEVEPASPSPLLPEDNGKESPPDATDNAESMYRFCIGVSPENQEVHIIPEGGQQRDGYMEGSNMEEDDAPEEHEEHSHYEKRSVLVELAPGEQAEGYCKTGRR